MSDKETVVVEKAVLDAILEKLDDLSSQLDYIEEQVVQTKSNTENILDKV